MVFVVEKISQIYDLPTPPPQLGGVEYEDFNSSGVRTKS